jgi:hypothetical protein
MSPTDTGLPEAHETQPRAHVATFRWLQGDGSSNLCVSFDAGPFLISAVHTTTALTGQEMLRNANNASAVKALSQRVALNACFSGSAAREHGRNNHGREYTWRGINRIIQLQIEGFRWFKGNEGPIKYYEL